ncbi:uncharacterized protein LOC103179628 [Callorhinchus milii]|nr:uncharacterized protein LOC103179628 [Callorhinchus milii]
MLQHENQDHILVKVQGEQHCILRIHQEITYEQFRTELELTFPEENLAVFYKEEGDLPLRISRQNSIEYVLKNKPEGDIVLEAEVTGDRQLSVKTDKHFLQRNKLTLTCRIPEINSSIEELRHWEILNEAEYEKLISVNLLKEQVRETLNFVIKKGNDAMDILHSLLQKHQPHLLKEIESKELPHSSCDPGHS